MKSVKGGRGARMWRLITGRIFYLPVATFTEKGIRRDGPKRSPQACLYAVSMQQRGLTKSVDWHIFCLPPTQPLLDDSKCRAIQKKCALPYIQWRRAPPTIFHEVPIWNPCKEKYILHTDVYIFENIEFKNITFSPPGCQRCIARALLKLHNSTKGPFVQVPASRYQPSWCRFVSSTNLVADSCCPSIHPY